MLLLLFAGGGAAPVDAGTGPSWFVCVTTSDPATDADAGGWAYAETTTDT